MALEHRFDIQFVAAQALREKQIQPVYRPYVAVHKWFARRPDSPFRSLALAESGKATPANLRAARNCLQWVERGPPSHAVRTTTSGEGEAAVFIAR